MVTGFPGCGVLFTPAAVDVVVQAWSGLLPIFAIGLSQVPFSTAISGCRMPPLAGAFAGAFFSWAPTVNAASARAATKTILDFTCSLRFASVSQSLQSECTLERQARSLRFFRPMML